MDSSVHEYKAGLFATCFENWQELTSDSYVLSCVRGLETEFWRFRYKKLDLQSIGLTKNGLTDCYFVRKMCDCQTN